jgi:hypothetical protein
MPKLEFTRQLLAEHKNTVKQLGALIYVKIYSASVGPVVHGCEQDKLGAIWPASFWMYGHSLSYLTFEKKKGL